MYKQLFPSVLLALILAGNANNVTAQSWAPTVPPAALGTDHTYAGIAAKQRRARAPAQAGQRQSRH